MIFLLSWAFSLKELEGPRSGIGSRVIASGNSSDNSNVLAMGRREVKAGSHDQAYCFFVCIVFGVPIPTPVRKHVLIMAPAYTKPMLPQPAAFHSQAR